VFIDNYIFLTEST